MRRSNNKTEQRLFFHVACHTIVRTVVTQQAKTYCRDKLFSFSLFFFFSQGVETHGESENISLDVRSGCFAQHNQGLNK